MSGTTLTTDRLTVTQAGKSDLIDYVKINASKDVRQWIVDGNTVDQPTTAERVQNYQNKLQKNDPFSAYAVRLKNGTFVGSVHFTPTDTPGTAELSYMFVVAYQNKGFCSEAAATFMYERVPALLQAKATIKDAPLTKAEATARTDNKPSNLLLKGLGFTVTHKAEKYGRLRYHYILDLTSTDYQVRCAAFNVLKDLCNHRSAAYVVQYLT